MKQIITLLSVAFLTAGCVKIPASWVSQDMVEKNNNNKSSQDYINSQNGMTQQASAKVDKWDSKVQQQRITSDYGKSTNQNKGFGKNEKFDLNKLNTEPVVEKKISKFANNSLNMDDLDSFGKPQKKKQVEVAKQSMGSSSPAPAKMLYAIDNNRRVPHGQYKNKKIKLNLNNLLGKDVNYLIQKMGEPNISSAQSGYFIWQYLSSADGLECTVDLTIKETKVQHVALLGPVNKLSQKKCLHNIVKFNLEAK